MFRKRHIEESIILYAVPLDAGPRAHGFRGPCAGQEEVETPSLLRLQKKHLARRQSCLCNGEGQQRGQKLPQELLRALTTKLPSHATAASLQ